MSSKEKEWWISLIEMIILMNIIVAMALPIFAHVNKIDKKLWQEFYFCELTRNEIELEKKENANSFVAKNPDSNEALELKHCYSIEINTTNLNNYERIPNTEGFIELFFSEHQSNISLFDWWIEKFLKEYHKVWFNLEKLKEAIKKEKNAEKEKYLNCYKRELNWDYSRNYSNLEFFEHNECLKEAEKKLTKKEKEEISKNNKEVFEVEISKEKSNDLIDLLFKVMWKSILILFWFVVICLCFIWIWFAFIYSIKKFKQIKNKKKKKKEEVERRKQMEIENSKLSNKFKNLKR